MLLVKNLDTPDDKRSFDHGEVQEVRLAGVTISRASFRPGWRWSQDVGPRAGTDRCPATHVAVVVAGRLHVEMPDGTSCDLGPGDAHVVGPGHDAWTVGDEPCITIDIDGAVMSSTARMASCPCGVSFRVDTEEGMDHLVAALQQHALGSHGHELTREHVLEELTTP